MSSRPPDFAFALTKVEIERLTELVRLSGGEPLYIRGYYTGIGTGLSVVPDINDPSRDIDISDYDAW